MMNIGILGCGKIAQVRHIPEYAANKDAKLIGFFDMDAQRTAEIAAKYGGKAYASVEELLADPAIDGVSVCVANHAHAQLAIAALQAGKHVLCEKPMAITLDECETMVAEAAKAGRRLLIGQNQRLAKAHVKAKELLEAGEIGKVVTFRTTFGHGGPETWSITPGKNTWFFDKKRAAMGAMADLGIHKTDMLRYILGQDIVRTTARLLTLDKRGADDQLIGVDDNAICIYETSGGAFGTMTASWTHYGTEDNSTILYGTRGIMRIYDDPVHTITIIPREGEVRHFDLEQIQTNDAPQMSSGVIDEFVEAVSAGRPSMLDAGDVLKSMKAVFASIRSSEEGRPVDVEL